MSFFLQAFAVIVGEEGGYTTDSSDAGNWTGAKVGVGLLKGTKYGISAAAYPNLDIPNLTLMQAQGIYHEDYWTPLDCDSRSWEFALVVFDAAVNQGVSAAKGILASTQTAAEFQAERGLRYARSDAFGKYGRGWFRRLFNVYKLAQVTPS